MKAPKVSVLIPTYNYARYLPEAVASVLEQDFEDYEILVIDDASQDDSAAVLQDLASRDPRIRCEVNSHNLGLAGNWNKCLAQARGDFVKYLFGDDRLADPQALGKMVRMLDAHPSAVMVASARHILDAQGRKVDLWDHCGRPGLQEGRSVIARCLQQGRNLIGEPSVVMIRREALERGFNAAYRQLIDLEMWFHLLEQDDLVYLREPLCAFRCHDTQQTVVNEQNQVGQQEGVLLLLQYLRKGWLPIHFRRQALFMHLYCLRKASTESNEIQSDLLRELGQWWFIVYWLRRRITMPFVNLVRSVRKRLR